MKNIFEIFRVFFIIFLRDKLNLFFSFFFNAFLMIMLGLFVTDRFTEIGTIGICDQLNTEFSHRFIKILEQEPTMKIKLFKDTIALRRAIKKGDLVAGLRINKPFELLKNPAFGSVKEAQLDLYGNSGKEFWIKMLSPGLKMAVLKTNVVSSRILSQIRVKTQMIESRNLDYFKFIFPGVLVFSIMGLSFTGAMSLLFFRKADVLKRLKITPLRKYEFLIGFICSYLVLLLLQAVLYIFIAWLVFGYTFSGNYLQIGILIFTCGLLFIVLGITIANIVPSVDAGNNIIRFLNFPSSFLCGIFIPVDTLPKMLKYFSVVHPLTYFADAMRNAVNYDASFKENAANYIILAAILIFFSIVSVVTFKWEEQTK